MDVRVLGLNMFSNGIGYVKDERTSFLEPGDCLHFLGRFYILTL